MRAVTTTDGHTEVTKLTVAICNSEEAPKNLKNVKHFVLRHVDEGVWGSRVIVPYILT